MVDFIGLLCQDDAFICVFKTIDFASSSAHFLYSSCSSICSRRTDQRRCRRNSWARTGVHEACWRGCEVDSLEHIDEGIIPTYNKPKKSNNAKVHPQGEWSSIISSLLIWELTNKNNFFVNYESTKEDADIIEYMKATPKRVFINIDNNWVNIDDIDCLFWQDEQVNGAISMFKTVFCIDWWCILNI